MSGKRWTREEEDAWEAFFYDGAPMPKDRALHIAIRRLKPDPIADLGDPEVAHATSKAAMAHLGKVPHRHDGDLVKFIETVQTIALSPWLEPNHRHPWPEDAFTAAVADARGAVR